MNIIIRHIKENDHYTIECVTKRAFWNLNMPGCDEHYLAHRLWKDPSLVPELSFTAEIDNEIVGAILYARCRVETDSGNVEVLSFGPLCVDPQWQKVGVGGKLLTKSITYYPQFGFKTADHWGITMPDGSNQRKVL